MIFIIADLLFGRKVVLDLVPIGCPIQTEFAIVSMACPFARFIQPRYYATELRIYYLVVNQELKEVHVQPQMKFDDSILTLTNLLETVFAILPAWVATVADDHIILVPTFGLRSQRANVSAVARIDDKILVYVAALRVHNGVCLTHLVQSKVGFEVVGRSR